MNITITKKNRRHTSDVEKYILYVWFEGYDSPYYIVMCHISNKITIIHVGVNESQKNNKVTA